jgi:outer membrane lipoprotein LolB
MLARARWSPGQASLNDGRQTQTYASFDAMTHAALGVALPQAALQDWVRGRPASGLPVQHLADGRFEQLGWQVQPVWRDGHLALLKAQRTGGDPAELRMAIESTTPQDKGTGTAGGN